MDYLKIYRKGDTMTKVSEKDKKNESKIEMKKEIKKGKKSVGKKKTNNDVNIKTYEKYTCFVVGLIIVLLFFSVLKNAIFIPALLITIGLEFFCIAYYYLEDKNKQNLVYGLFIFGVGLVIAAIIYTIFNTI